MQLFAHLVNSFDPADINVRPTALFNEGWMLNLLLHHLSRIPDSEHPLRFLPGATWCSEARLPTVFKARLRGDPLAESRTSADGVVGHISVGRVGKTDLELEPSARQFTVVEAKIGSPLSPGIQNDPDYDQAARMVACMAETIACSPVDLGDLVQLDFIVLAPELAIESGIFTSKLGKESIHARVRERVSAYGGEHDAWFKAHFEPLLEQVRVEAVSWEESIGWLVGTDPVVASDLLEFYGLCLEHL